jgi:asparagine synthase (glutamine-hydrolysing)
MCGIAALFAYRDDAPRVERDELIVIRDHMASRGPDGSGEWFSADGRVGLGHRRLSIIDLSPSGAQPMFNQDRSLAIIFNGEIYNYGELRSQLLGKGYQFQSNSDTEVLLQLYAEKGEAMMQDLRGMYAFAVWDERRQGMLLARDPFGIKPLYYSDDGQTFRLASQVKALRAGGQIDLTPDPAGHVGYFLWGNVPDPYTLFKNIRSLPAGSTMWVGRDGARKPKVFCNVSTILADAEQMSDARCQMSRVSSREQLRSALCETVRYHMVADVPVGVFLSSGLDSTTIAALAAEQGENLRAVTLGFEEYRGTNADETPLAEHFAQRCGTTHQTVWVSRADFEAERDDLFKAMDTPSIDGVNTYFVSLAARRAGLKVALSGVGGDEFFASYPSFREIPRSVRFFKSFAHWRTFGSAVRYLSAPVLMRMTSPKYAGTFEYAGTYGGAYLLRRGMFMPWELPELLDPEIVREGWAELQSLVRLDETLDGIQSPRLKVSALEMQWYMRHQLLRDSDWAGMGHSLEIRVPFVDVDFLKQLAPRLSQADAPDKREMAAAASDLMTPEVLDRPKTGFQIPVREWLLHEVPESSMRGPASVHRGLRGWAKYVYHQHAGQSLLHPSAARSWPAPISKRPRGRSARGITANRRILVYRIGQLGDTIIALPAMRAVRAHCPDATIELLCDRHEHSGYVLAAEILEPTGIFDGFITYDLNRKRAVRRSQFIELIPTLRRKRFDTIVYLAPSQRTRQQIVRDRLFFRLVGITHFYGFRNFPILPRKLAGQSLPAVKSEGDLLLDRLAADGIDVPLPGGRSLDLSLSNRDEERVSQWLTGCPSDGGRRWIGVGPGCKQPVNRWSLENYAATMSRLMEKFDVWPVIFGGREDLEAGEFLLKRVARGYNAAGKLDVRTTAAAMRRCTLFVGNDTGTMHIASTAGIPCVGIYSARQWRGLWEPYTPLKRILRSEIECEGCGLSECVVRKMECLTRITPEMAVAACAEFLESETGGYHLSVRGNRIPKDVIA